MLLYPLEKQLDLPAASIAFGNGRCLQSEVVGQEDKTPVVHCIEESDPAKLCRISLPCREVLGKDNLIALHPGGFLGRLRVESSEPEVVLGPDHEECSCLMDRIKACKIDIAPVHDVDGTCFYYELVEDVHFVDLAMGDDYDRGNAAPKIQKGMELYCPFAFPELRPGKQRKAEIDNGGIQCIDGLVQLYPEGVSGIQFSGSRDQNLSEIGVDPPVSHLVGVGQGIPGDFAPDAQMIQLGLSSPQTGLNVPQTFPIRQLGKCHAEVLVPAGEALDLVVPVVASDAHTKVVNRQEVHQLREYGSTIIHQPSPSAGIQKYGLVQKIISNRLQPFFLVNHHQYLIHNNLSAERWDSSVKL